jgi:hypothetical protein
MQDLVQAYEEEKDARINERIRVLIGIWHRLT